MDCHLGCLAGTIVGREFSGGKQVESALSAARMPVSKEEDRCMMYLESPTESPHLPK
jgi:hypothetical protein